MAITPEQIRSRLRQAFPQADIRVEDTTGGGDHYAARIVSDRFVSAGLVDRHRLVYAALGDAMKSDIHALALTTLTPAEAEGIK